jgi:adenine deaminase
LTLTGETIIDAKSMRKLLYAELTRRLVDVAMGRKASRPGHPRRAVGVRPVRRDHPPYRYCHQGERDRLRWPDASHTIGEQTQVIDAAGRYLVPGLLDAHMHVESGMLTVTEFVRAVLPRGSTGMFVDPHEIANVFG